MISIGYINFPSRFHLDSGPDYGAGLPVSCLGRQTIRAAKPSLE